MQTQFSKYKKAAKAIFFLQTGVLFTRHFFIANTDTNHNANRPNGNSKR